MRMVGECYGCALRQALSAARLVCSEESLQVEVLRRAASVLAGAEAGLTPPEVGEKIYRIVREATGNPDPFKEQKRLQNENVISILPRIRRIVSEAKDPLLMALRLAAAGNAIDTGAQESYDLEESIIEAVRSGGKFETYEQFRLSFERAKDALVIADNCGEIVFDKVLIETMLQEKVKPEFKIYLAVRGGPIINDVTLEEAEDLGLSKVCEIVPTGMEMPGTILNRCDPVFLRLFESVDLVISKGQGNWETLEDVDREIYFLFQAKCETVARANNCKIGELLMVRGGRD